MQNLKEKRIGETRMQNCGLTGRIVGYRSVLDIDVRFYDGYTAKHRQYTDFKRGTIRHPKIPINKKDKVKRIGEKHMQKCGLMAKIIDYRNAKDMDVEFSDGTVVKHTDHTSFKHGYVGHPKMSNKNKFKNKAPDYIRQKHVQKNGLEVEIIGYHGDYVDVRFPDGKISKHIKYTTFVNGTLIHPDVPKNKKDKRLNEIRTQKCGIKAKITRYHTAADVDITFEDGTTNTNKRYYSFITGQIKHPTMNTHFPQKIGQIHPEDRSKIYHTEIHGIAYIIDDTYYYFCHCPLCQTHNIWTFNEIKSHTCNQELVSERENQKQK